MFNKILVATDLSSASDCLLQCVGELKAVGLKKAVLAHVLYVANTPGLEDAMAKEAAPILARQKQFLETQGIEVVTEMPFGLPALTLRDISEKHDVGAIFIGSRGQGLLQRTLLGSVAFKLLQVTKRPVLLGRVGLLGEGEACQISVCQRLFDHILFLADFSESSAHAFDRLEKIIAVLHTPVTLLHVIDSEHSAIHLSGQALEELRETCRGQLEVLKERLEKAGGQVTVALVEGNPKKEVLERSSQGGYSLIAMGTQGKGFFREAFLGSLANEVARRAELPVLFFPWRI